MKKSLFFISICVMLILSSCANQPLQTASSDTRGRIDSSSASNTGSSNQSRQPTPANAPPRNSTSIN